MTLRPKYRLPCVCTALHCTALHCTALPHCCSAALLRCCTARFSSLEYAQTRQRLLYGLNASGRYHAFKEQLKIKVLAVIRERFSDAAKSLASKQEQQNLISRLYVHLSQKMHATYELATACLHAVS